MKEPWTLRQPCKDCGGTRGYREDRNGQDCAYCEWCREFVYCIPKSESGREVRSVRTRPAFKPGQRRRILDRDNGSCVLCHASDKPIHVGHLLSVEDGRDLGATDAELFDDENLAAMCEECNLGFGRDSVSLRLVLSILRARIIRRAAA